MKYVAVVLFVMSIQGCVSKPLCKAHILNAQSTMSVQCQNAIIRSREAVRATERKSCEEYRNEATRQLVDRIEKQVAKPAKAEPKAGAMEKLADETVRKTNDALKELEAEVLRVKPCKDAFKCGS